MTPLPNPQFYILLSIRFIEPISFSLIFPFVYFMVRDFNLGEDAQIGYYAGLVSAAYAVGEFLGSVPWGMLSDRIGRKPVITMGLLGTMLSLFMFGLSTSMAWAMTTRFMGGVLNGNVGVVKSMISEMTDKTNRTKAFSFISMMLGLGFIVGPVLGGFLTHPAENFPQLFGNVQFLKDYPYFLPCGVTSFLCGIGSIFAYIYLEETLTRSPPIPSVVTPLLNPRTQPPPKFLDISKGTWLVIVVFMGLSLMVAMSEELFTVWASTSIRDGGLGFTPKDLGTFGSIMGIIMVLIQMFIFVRLQQRFGTLNLMRKAYLLYAFLFPIIPIARIYVVNQPMLAWALLIVLHAFKTLCTVIGFTTANILLPETCQNKAHLGHINGVSLALCSLMRGVGPYICGVIYSKSLTSHLCFPLDYHFAFFVVAMVSGLSWSFSNKIKPEMYG